MPGESNATIEVNSTELEAELSRSPFPQLNWLYLGAYLSNDKMTTTFDNLGVSALGAAKQSTGVGLPVRTSLRYLGYYAARITNTGGNHLGEVRGRTNLNWVNISDYSRYAPEVLDECAPKSCVVYTGHEFFTGCDKEASPTCDLYPNYRDRWKRLADYVRPQLDKVAAFYVLDEPYHRGAWPEEVATSAKTIKETFPGARVMMVEAGPKVTSSMVVPPEVDWVGFDWYCRSATEVGQTLRTLEARTTQDQGLFLFPQVAPLKACGTKAGYQSDADIAALQWAYMKLAMGHPRVIGLMGFGLWVEDTPASMLHDTIDASERIAARVLTLTRSVKPEKRAVSLATARPPTLFAPARVR